MTTPKPRPLGRGVVTPRRVNEVVEARVLDVVGDGVVQVSRVGSRVVVGVSIPMLRQRLPWPRRLVMGVIKARSAATGVPSDITYTVAVDAPYGDPDGDTYENKTPQIRWVEAGGPGQINAAAVDSRCVLEPTRDESGVVDYNLIVCNETLRAEACDPPSTLQQVDDEDLRHVLTDRFGSPATDRFGALLLDRFVPTGSWLTALSEAIATDRFGALSTDRFGVVQTIPHASLLFTGAGVGVASRIATDRFGNPATDRFGVLATIAVQHAV